MEDRRKDHVSKLNEALAPSAERKRPEPTACMISVAKDIMQMHKQLASVLSREQLHSVLVQVLSSFDDGLLAAYQQVDSKELYTRQCIVADALHLRTQVTKLHLYLPDGVCPKLVQFAQTLNVRA